eukprot:IDg19075t1
MMLRRVTAGARPPTYRAFCAAERATASRASHRRAASPSAAPSSVPRLLVFTRTPTRTCCAPATHARACTFALPSRRISRHRPCTRNGPARPHPRHPPQPTHTAHPSAPRRTRIRTMICKPSSGRRAAAARRAAALCARPSPRRRNSLASRLRASHRILDERNSHLERRLHELHDEQAHLLRDLYIALAHLVAHRGAWSSPPAHPPPARAPDGIRAARCTLIEATPYCNKCLIRAQCGRSVQEPGQEIS